LAKRTSHPRERPTIIYGIHPVVETIRAGRRRIHDVYLARDVSGLPDIELLLAESPFPVAFMSREQVSARAGSPHHQGIAAWVGAFPYVNLDELVSETDPDRRLMVVLDGVQDPVNVGTILRSAECFGAYAVVLTRDRSAPITPVAEKSSSGASAHIPVARVINLARSLESIKNAGYWVYAADQTAGSSCYAMDLTGKVAIVLGSEGTGIRRLVKDRCDGAVSIPMRGRIESLNVSQAAAVILSESLRQRLAREQAMTPRSSFRSKRGKPNSGEFS
jgi:23S rRNA (guanosine2251-2'-O)-methyltransferase